MIGYGVVPLTKNVDANRKFFEFAKAMGLKYLSASPEPGCFDVLDKLVEEYDVAIGIHNHGPGSPLREDRQDRARRSRITIPRSAAASTRAISSGRGRIRSMPSRSSASGFTASI